jgi:hypothetical protein
MKNITYLFLTLSIISEGACLMASQPQELSPNTKELLSVLQQSSQESPELIESIKQLLINGADVNATIYYGYTALHMAAAHGQTELCKLLIQEHANVNATNNYGSTAFHRAAEKGHTEVCKLLIQEHANVNATNSDGSTTLHMAANKGHTEVCKLLIQEHADVNATDNYGSTALHRAAANGHTETALILAPQTVLIPINEAASSMRILTTLCLCRRIGLPKDIHFYILQYLEDDVIECAMPYLRRKLAAQECIVIPPSLRPLLSKYLSNHTIESVKSIILEGNNAIETVNRLIELDKFLRTKNIKLDMLLELFGKKIHDNICQLLTQPDRVTVLGE